MICVLGPMHDAPRWSWNVGIPGELGGPMLEQVFFGPHHAMPGPFPEAYAVKVAAAINNHPVVQVYAPRPGRHFGELRRTLRVPDHWCLCMVERGGWDMVRAELGRIVVI